MSWVRLDDGFADHPKVFKVGPVAFAVHVWGLCYSGRFLTDGFVPEDALKGNQWAKGRGLKPALSRLLNAGLWTREEGGYRIHDYLEYNPAAASVKEDRAKTAERVAKYRKKKKGDGNGVTGESGNAAGNAAPSPKGTGLRPSPSLERSVATGPDGAVSPSLNDSGEEGDVASEARSVLEVLTLGAKRPAYPSAGLGRCEDCGRDDVQRDQFGRFALCPKCVVGRLRANGGE